MDEQSWAAIKDAAAGIPFVGGIIRAGMDYFDGTYDKQAKEVSKQALLEDWERRLAQKQLTIDAATADSLDHIAAALTASDLNEAKNRLDELKQGIGDYITGPQKQAMLKAYEDQKTKISDLSLQEDAKQKATPNADKTQDLSLSPQ